MQTVKISDHQSNQQIIKAVISDIVSSLSGTMLGYGMGFMLLHNTHSPLSFGLDVAIDPIIDFLLFIPIGNYVDRHNHKHILIVNYIMRLLLLVFFAMLLPMFAKSQELIPVMIFVAFSELFSNVSGTTYTASVHELVNQHKIASLNSYEQACSAGASFFAPVFDAVLYSLVSINTFITIDFLATAFAFSMMLTMHFFIKKEPAKAKAKPIKHQQLHDFKVGLNYIKKRKLIQDLMIIACVANLLGSLLTVAPSYVIVEKLHLPNEVVSFLDSGLIFGIVIGSILVNIIIKKTSSLSKLLTLSNMLGMSAIGMCTIALGFIFNYVTGFWMVTILGILIALIIGLFLGVMNVSTGVRMQSTIPTKLMGRVSSVSSAVNTIFMPIGTIIFSFLLKHFTNDIYIFVITGVLLIVYFMLYTHKFSKDVKINNKFVASAENN